MQWTNKVPSTTSLTEKCYIALSCGTTSKKKSLKIETSQFPDESETPSQLLPPFNPSLTSAITRRHPLALERRGRRGGRGGGLLIDLRITHDPLPTIALSATPPPPPLKAFPECRSFVCCWQPTSRGHCFCEMYGGIC